MWPATWTAGSMAWWPAPVINALSDLYHPCQALADIQAIRERFGGASLHGFKLTFIGDGNNVAQSLMLTGLRLGMDFALGCPEGCSPFSHVTTCMFTEPLKRPFTPKAPTTSLPSSSLRLLPGGANQFLGGSIPH